MEGGMGAIVGSVAIYLLLVNSYFNYYCYIAAASISGPGSCRNRSRLGMIVCFYVTTGLDN